MPIDYPLSRATGLEPRPGSHPVKVYRAQNGSSRTRLFGSAAVDAGFTVRHRCTTAQVAAVWACYHQSRSGALPIRFPATLFSGHEQMVAAFPAGLSWFFLSEPRPTPLKQGLCDLSVEFEGRLEV